MQALGEDHALHVLCEWDETDNTVIKASKIGEGGEQLMGRVEGPAKTGVEDAHKEMPRKEGQKEGEGLSREDQKRIARGVCCFYV